MDEARFSCNFRLWRRGVPFQFTVRSDDSYEIHTTQVVTTVEHALKRGFSLHEHSGQANCAPDEKAMRCDAYVAVQYTNDVVVKLLGRKFAWCVVYPEDFNKLWFTPDLSTVWPSSGLKDRDEAANAGYLRTVEPKLVVKKENGLMAVDGQQKMTYRFWRVEDVDDHGGAKNSPSGSAPNVAQGGAGTAPPPQPGQQGVPQPTVPTSDQIKAMLDMPRVRELEEAAKAGVTVFRDAWSMTDQKIRNDIYAIIPTWIDRMKQIAEQVDANKSRQQELVTEPTF